MQRGASQRSSEDPMVRQRGTVSNRGEGGIRVLKQTTGMHQAPLGNHCEGWKQMRALLFHKFLQPLSRALGKECVVQKEQEGGSPSPPFPTVAAHQLLLSCSFYLSTDWKPTRLL